MGQRLLRVRCLLAAAAAVCVSLTIAPMPIRPAPMRTLRASRGVEEEEGSLMQSEERRGARRKNADEALRFAKSTAQGLCREAFAQQPEELALYQDHN